PEFLGGRLKGQETAIDTIYYLLPLSAGISVLLTAVFAFGDKHISHPRMARLPWVLLLCASPGYTALQHATHLIRRDQDPFLNTPERNYLRGRPPGNYQLYVVENEDLIGCYYEFRILSPSRWIYQHFWTWYDNWDPDGRVLRSVGKDLLDHHTTYVIM